MQRMPLVLFAVAMLANSANAQTVNLTSRRLDLNPATRQQLIDLTYNTSDFSSGVNVFGNYSNADDYYVQNAIGTTLTPPNVILQPDVSATAKCNGVLNQLLRGPLVGVAGNVKPYVRSQSAFTTTYGLAEVRDSTSSADFQVLPHPTIQTSGNVTLRGWFQIVITGGNQNTDFNDTFAANGAVALGGSNLSITRTSLTAPWIVQGVLTQSSGASPNAPPINYYAEYPADTFEVLIPFTQRVGLNNVIAMNTRMNMRATVQQFGIGEKSVTRGYSMNAWYTISDTQVNP